MVNVDGISTLSAAPASGTSEESVDLKGPQRIVATVRLSIVSFNTSLMLGGEHHRVHSSAELRIPPMKDLEERKFRKYGAFAFVMLFALAFGALSVRLGQDANWDLKNYHLYNAYELLHGRLRLDLNAGGFQSLFNPLPDLPYYALALQLFPGFPRLVAFIMGLNSALVALAATSIVFIVFRNVRSDISWVAMASRDLHWHIRWAVHFGTRNDI